MSFPVGVGSACPHRPVLPTALHHRHTDEACMLLHATVRSSGHHPGVLVCAEPYAEVIQYCRYLNSTNTRSHVPSESTDDHSWSQ